MIEIEAFIFDQMDSLLQGILDRAEEDEALLGTIDYDISDQDDDEGLSLPTVVYRAIRCEGASGGLGSLHRLAIDCQCFGKSYRLERLTHDIAAIAWLYRAMSEQERAHAKEHHSEKEKIVEPGATLGSAVKRAKNWADAIEKLGAALREVHASARDYSASLAGVAALELVLDRILARAAPASEADGLYRRLAKADVRRLVSSYIFDARLQCLIGGKNETLVHDFDKALTSEGNAAMALSDGEYYTDIAGFALGLDDDEVDTQFEAEQIRLAAETKRQIFGLVRLLVDRSLVETNLAKWAAEVHGELAKLSGRRQVIVPSSEKMLAWGVARLIDGWQARESGVNPPRRLDITQPKGRAFKGNDAPKKYTSTYLRELCLEIAQTVVFEPAGNGEGAFVSPVADVTFAFHSYRERGGRKRPFFGRRKYGIEVGEFAPDELDRLTRMEADSLRRSGFEVPPENILPEPQRLKVREGTIRKFFPPIWVEKSQ